MALPSTAEVFDACRILFGTEVNLSIDFLKYLQPSGIKAAYWKKALETHPDRAKMLGQSETLLSKRFREVTTAYETLATVIQSGDSLLLDTYNPQQYKQRRNRTASSRPMNRRRYRPKDHYYSGQLPQRTLLLGQYLYYSGLISWRTLIEAVLWQRQNRPLLGQIAIDWRILSLDDIYSILKERQLNERFGECAVRKGYMTKHKLMALLGKQRLLQKPIGEYFIQQQIFNHRALNQIVSKQRLHNRINV